MAQMLPERKTKSYSTRKAPPTASNEYHKLYRFTDDNVTWLAKHFLDKSDETRGGSLTTKQRMEVTLRYLANPGFQTGISNETGIHRSTVSKTVSITLQKILIKASQWIVFPHTEEQILKAKPQYCKKFKRSRF